MQRRGFRRQSLLRACGRSCGRSGGGAARKLVEACSTRSDAWPVAKRHAQAWCPSATSMPARCRESRAFDQTSIVFRPPIALDFRLLVGGQCSFLGFEGELIHTLHIAVIELKAQDLAGSLGDRSLWSGLTSRPKTAASVGVKYLGCICVDLFCLSICKFARGEKDRSLAPSINLRNKNTRLETVSPVRTTPTFHWLGIRAPTWQRESAPP